MHFFLLSENFAFIIFRLVFLLICSSNSFLALKFFIVNWGKTPCLYEPWLTKAREGLQPLAYANKSLIVLGLSGIRAVFSWDEIELYECFYYTPLIFILLTKFFTSMLESLNSKELLRIFISSGPSLYFEKVALLICTFSAFSRSNLLCF